MSNFQKHNDMGKKGYISEFMNGGRILGQRFLCGAGMRISISISISAMRRMRSWASFRKYDGLRLNTSDSVMFVVSNGKAVCKIMTGTKRAHKRPTHTNRRLRMNSEKAVSLIKSGSKSVFKFLNS